MKPFFTEFSIKMKIKISNLADGKYDYAFEGDLDELDIDDPYTEQYKTEIVLNKFEDQIILDAETSINTNLVCDRCNGDYNRAIKSNFRIVYFLREGKILRKEQPT